MNSPSSDLPRRRVVGYARVSTKEQAKDGNSLEAQENQIRAYAEYKQGEFLRTFLDKEKGESAVKIDFLERAAVADMLLFAKENGATDIVVTKLDRGFRNAVDLLLTIEILSGHGLRLHLLDIGLDPTTPTGEMVATIMAAVARFECRRRGERQRDAFAVIKKNGKGCGPVPYGWTVVQIAVAPGTRRRAPDLIPDPEEQRVLQQITAWHDAGETVSAIARYLNDAGAPTKHGGKKWFPASVASVLKHRRLSPEVRSQRSEVSEEKAA